MNVSWIKIEAAPSADGSVPCPRSSHGLSFIPRAGAPMLILHGGENVARTPISDPIQCTWAADYSPAEKTWQWRSVSIDSTSSSPPPRVAHAQAAIGSKVYIFGGRMGIHMDEKPLSDMWVLDTAGESGTEFWSQVEYNLDDGDVPPEARSFHKMLAVGKHLFVFGGCGASGRLADLHKFDTETKTWTTIGPSSILKGRGGANLIQLSDGKLAVLAGFAGEETNDGHICATEGDVLQWEENGMEGLYTMRPRSVCVSASFPTKNVAIVFGGEVDPSDRGHEGAGGFENDVVVLDYESGTLKETIKAGASTSELQWPGNRGWADGDAGEIDESSGPCLFVFGGLTGDDENPKRLADLWQCTIKE